MTARIFVGACSWADKTLVDSGWYPPQAKTPEDRLRFYAEHFPIVEGDATYYGLPLDSAGKLGTVLFQFPPWFLPGRDSSDYILEAKERLGQYTIAVEFRNNLWLSERNHETWEKKGIGAAERFDYLYSEEELEEWLPHVRQLAEGAREVHVLMNNCHNDFAVRNARQLADRLGAVRPGSASGGQPPLL